MPFQTAWLTAGTRIEPETIRIIPQINPRIVPFIKKMGISLAGRSNPVSSTTAERCQVTKASVVQRRTCLSDLPLRFRLAQSQPRKNPSSVIMTMSTPVELIIPMLNRVLSQSASLLSIAPKKPAIAAARPSIRRALDANIAPL